MMTRLYNLNKSIFSIIGVLILFTMMIAGCTSPEEKLLQGVKKQDAEAVRQALEKGVSPDMKDETGTPLLISALETGQPEIAELLIQKGAAVKIQNQEGVSAFRLALDSGYTDLAMLIIKKGADAKSALIPAVQSGPPELVGLLLKKGADLKTTDEQGNTLVDIAVEHKQAEIEAFLRKKGLKTKEEIRLAEEAAAEKKRLAAELCEAAKAGDLDRIRAALDKGADINAATSYNGDRKEETSGWTALTIATFQGRVDIMRFLLKRGADTDVKPEWQEPPLLMAIQKNQPEMIRLLAENGANLEIRGPGCAGPLGSLAWRGQKDLVQLFLEKGANPNALDAACGTRFKGKNIEIPFISDSGSPLSDALVKGHLDIAQLLVDYGADVNQNIHGWTALMKAALWANPKAVKFLLDQGADVNQPVTDPKSKTIIHSGCTPLIFAAIGGDATIVQSLLDRHADLQATCSINRHDNKNALYYAELEKNEAIVRLLKKAETEQ